MSAPKQPKVILFDIGGVCVRSPFQAILDYELSHGIPPGWVNYSLSATAPNGYWHRLERGETSLDDDWFKGFSEDLHDPARWEAFHHQSRTKDPTLPTTPPSLPSIDGKWLFNEMMSASSHPDPWMYPALINLRASGKYILAALSNTIIFPPGHRLYAANFFDEPIRKIFDVFVSSAHVGIRKPDPKMYQYALSQLDHFAKSHADNTGESSLGWEYGVEPRDILFLDDIGENLKEARNQGFGTLKVNLGRAFEAVDELERITGLKLAGDHPRIPVGSREKGEGAKL